MHLIYAAMEMFTAASIEPGIAWYSIGGSTGKGPPTTTHPPPTRHTRAPILQAQSPAQPGIAQVVAWVECSDASTTTRHSRRCIKHGV